MFRSSLPVCLMIVQAGTAVGAVPASHAGIAPATGASWHGFVVAAVLCAVGFGSISPVFRRLRRRPGDKSSETN